MKNLGVFCVAIIIFSTGIILGAELNSIGIEKQVAIENKKLDSIQDIVVKNIQDNQNDNKDYQEETKMVVAVENKISPYATLTIEKYFKNCGHSTKESIDIPKELVNMTKEELQNKYEKWEIKKFEDKDVHLYRQIDANCSAHFVVKEDAGKVAVFAQISDENMQFKKTTNIDFETLREEDKNLIKKGIKLYGEEELSSFIEDFES